MVNRLPEPESAIEWLLGLIFGSPSLVVSTFIVFNTLWAWWSLGRSTVTIAMVTLNRSHDRFSLNSLKIKSTLRLLLAWLCWYALTSLVTQIWAGSQYSPTQGGGLEELLQWSAVFGAIAVVGCFLLTPTHAPIRGDPGWAPYLGLYGGYALGLLWAIIAFTFKGGPEAGDWWVCPALSCVGVLGSSLRVRIRAAGDSGSSTPTPN